MLPNDTPSRLHAIVEGRVQGVGFRMFVLETARNLNLTGWVRNRWNGDVEVLAEGPRSALENLLSKLRVGPPAAHVTGVHFEWQQPTGEFKRFDVRATSY
ncbi:acylphosphatases [Bellilinea caldifistulae]|uniref:Acylphosphatase n=1 Tax=Bellilinea caldifistulae TaxID=360411 RepID=A0A0P6X2S8_9CHLR|nr:acylphosphatase [Bellilinea caldifistulae]KPL73997.1 acylphosphatase [Bellilinea caldifistulae]GAP11274.1 acylphosphatases [Bellilinea caldifistulae]GIV65013.1 MAG: acylphosphatase [Bellilinea sp.]